MSNLLLFKVKFLMLLPHSTALKLIGSIWPDCDDLIVPNFEIELIIYSNLHLAPSPPTLAYKGAAGRIVPRGAVLYVNPPLHPEM